MSLISFAVIGKDNAPLYIRDFEYEKDCSDPSLSGSEFRDDPFGFLNHTQLLNGYSSLKNQFIIHSALDNFEELDALNVDRPQHGPNSMWVGFLGHFDDTKVYAYATSTKIKFFATIEDIEDESNNIAREAALKALFANAHEYFVEYMMNPFSNVRTQKKIISQRFDMGIMELATTFNENFGQKGMSWM